MKTECFFSKNTAFLHPIRNTNLKKKKTHKRRQKTDELILQQYIFVLYFPRFNERTPTNMLSVRLYIYYSWAIQVPKKCFAFKKRKLIIKKKKKANYLVGYRGIILRTRHFGPSHYKLFGVIISQVSWKLCKLFEEKKWKKFGTPILILNCIRNIIRVRIDYYYVQLWRVNLNLK